MIVELLLKLKLAGETEELGANWSQYRFVHALRYVREIFL
jgi:hypothetical protein